jgi:hypothetical protein
MGRRLRNTTPTFLYNFPNQAAGRHGYIKPADALQLIKPAGRIVDKYVLLCLEYHERYASVCNNRQIVGRELPGLERLLGQCGQSS